MASNGIDPKKLGAAVHHWLCFQNLCGRSELFSEHYLSQPIGEYLLHHHTGDLKTEMNHPNLNTGNQRGRPRQIDFCLLSRDIKAVTAAFELKWVSGANIDKQRIVDDLFRLELLRTKEKQNVDRYFVIAGEERDFEQNFVQSQVNSGEGSSRIEYFGEFLDFQTDNSKTVKIERLSNPQKNDCEKFGKSYGVLIPKSFITTRQFGESKDGFTVYIWKVNSVPKRSTYKT